MSMESYLTELFSNLVFIPAALLCYLPMKNRLKYGRKKTILGMSFALCVFIPLLALVDTVFNAGYNMLFIPVLIIFLFIYHETLSTPFSQTLAVFVLICAFFSFNSNFSNVYDAFLHPAATIEDYSLQAAVFQFISGLIFAALLFLPLARYGSWLIDNFRIGKVWYIGTGVSAIFLAFNLLIIPKRYETLHVNNMARVFFTVVPMMLLLLLLLCWIFYSIVHGMVDMAETRDRNRILEMEESQYRKLRTYMEESAKARHDFRHVIGTLDELLSEGNNDAARQYLTSYTVQMPKNEVISYCEHAALNALLNYYGATARQYEIRVRINADLPTSLPLSDADLCNIVGNIFDNAITACLDIPKTDRYINLTLSCPNDVRFGIVASNSFSGEVRMDGERYLSTHRGGSGIGLESIRTAAEKYGGNVSFRHEGKEFISGVVIPIK
ncbi:MAG: GHKL domain-containing protein [Lachnospiraceae bacterium]|nr:GHKL domain-containing protein [Lachnospiraceae bacterium]